MTSIFDMAFPGSSAELRFTEVEWGTSPAGRAYEVTADFDNLHPVFGPAGAAGVSPLRMGDEMITICCETDRVCSIAWGESSPADGLLRFFVSEIEDTSGEHGMSRLDGVPVEVDGTRSELVRFAHLSEHVRNYQLEGGPNDDELVYANCLLWIELAASTVGTFHAIDPRPYLQRATTLAGKITADGLARQLGDWKSIQSVASGLENIARRIELAPYGEPRAREVSEQLLAEIRALVAGLERAGGYQGAPMSIVDLAPSAGLPEVRESSGAAAVSVVTVGQAVPDARDLVMLVDEEQVTGTWHVLRVTPGPEVNVFDRLSVRAHGADGAMVGAAELFGMASRTGRIATGAPPAEYRFSRGPLWEVGQSLHTTARRAHQVGHAAWLSWVAAKQQNRRPGTSEVLYAVAAQHWLAVGLVHRAAWAYHRADKNLVAQLVDDAELLIALQAVPPPPEPRYTDGFLWLFALPRNYLTRRAEIGEP